MRNAIRIAVTRAAAAIALVAWQAAVSAATAIEYGLIGPSDPPVHFSRRDGPPAGPAPGGTSACPATAVRSS